MAIGTLGATLAGAAGGSLGGGSWSDSESTQKGLGFGTTTGKSWEQGGSENSGYSDSSSWGFSDAWSKEYGSEASAKDIKRAQEANALQEKWNKAQMDFQEYMSNTAFQRMVKDMEKADINPRYLFGQLGQGASTTSGANAQVNKAQTFVDKESQSHSENGSESHSETSGSSYNIGGSEQNGININLNTGKSTSKSVPGFAGLFGNLAKGIKSGKGNDGYDNPSVSN